MSKSTPLIRINEDKDSSSLGNDGFEYRNDGLHQEQLCDDFTTAISFLSVEAVNLKKLTCLRVAVETESETHGTNDCIQNDDTDTNSHKTRSVINQLSDMEQVVSSMEKQICIVQAVIAEEKKAIDQLQGTKRTALQQKETIRELLIFCTELCDTSENVKQLVKPNQGVRKSVDAEPSLSINQTTMPKQNPFSQLVEQVSTSHNSTITTKKSKELIVKADPSIVTLQQITEAELHGVSKAIRGRLSLSVLNDALRDIECAIQNKYSILARQGPLSNKNHHNIPGDKKYKKCIQYQQMLAQHRDLLVDEHCDQPWISEQDLRDSCAFFRSGESTARATLHVLRSLKRLKQVSGKHSQVTYVCLQG